jgi:hypothetical protein
VVPGVRVRLAHQAPLLLFLSALMDWIGFSS